ncbi:hypothetical protein LOTGIDRAFT_230885 [Lottia gigantea]|uniref:C3H1-type domain-containing protein n=1 Tax=Lottia gigantea TaxID=225164 RepID=V4A7N3_LOTGI|nr:hypothetical protein LOTGIDRAFT_230885 [Lottia gigantea]ESO99958.1 hypothetical protein LOTGIDRAFT_230885 [Lottia gigantea]
MIIEDPDSLKAWLGQSLTPLCDADPSALTNYIYALVKKDKPESEIRENCLDQLDVFLQNKTVTFVDSLFNTLKDKSYVGLVKPAPPKALSPVVSTTTSEGQPTVQLSTTITQVAPDTTNTGKEPVKPEVKDKKRPDEVSSDRDWPRDSRRRRTRSRSRSRSGSPRRRDSDDRRRRYDRSRYSPPRRYGRRRSRSRSPRRWSPDRRRSRSPRNRSRDRSRSRSRSRSRGRQPDSRGSTPTQDNGNYSNIVTTNTGSRIPSSIAVVTSTDDIRKDGGGVANRSNQRCRDYDEKGFCMRGDLCPFDHGVDPVVVEDSGIPCVIPFPPTTSGPPPGLPPPGLPPIAAGPPPDFSKPPPPIVHRPPPPTEVYNPEAPGLTGPRPTFWPGGPRPPRPPGPYFSQPPPNMNPLSGPRQRDLVTVKTLPAEGEKENEKGESRVVVPSKRTYDMIDQSHQQQQQQHGSQPKRHFDFARLGGYRKPNPNMENSCLEVRKIPRELNNIAKLNEHFGKFGTLVNLQICYEGDLEAALVTYSDNQSAFSAYRSSEPVFNNRFIKVFWHKKQEAGDGQTTDLTVQKPMESKPVQPRLAITIPHHSKLSLNNKNKQDKEIVYTSSIGNLKKTVINSAAINKTQSAMTSPTAVGSADFVKRIEEIKKKEEIKQEALKKKVEIQKQKQNLLEKEIGHQKVLIEKLENNKTMSSEEKGVIMKTLKTLTDSIDKLKLELLPQKSTKNPDETRKEILDTELELINKQNAGEDTTTLRLKLTQLTKEAQSLGLFGRGRGRGARGRGSMRARGVRGRGGYSAFGRGRGGGSMTLDNRPKVIEVRNFDLEEKEEIKNHFNTTGQVDKCEFIDSIPSAIITFKTRKSAELAISRGSKFKNKVLSIKWYSGITRTISSEEPGGESEEEESALTEELDEDSLLAGDDEEDEDEESRSWRR